jgi:hypothetical protein
MLALWLCKSILAVSKPSVIKDSTRFSGHIHAQRTGPRLGRIGPYVLVCGLKKWHIASRCPGRYKGCSVQGEGVVDFRHGLFCVRDGEEQEEVLVDMDERFALEDGLILRVQTVGLPPVPLECLSPSFISILAISANPSVG